MAKSDEQIERESNNKQRAALKKEGFILKIKGGQTADWAGVDGGVLVRCVAAISVGGGAIRLGYTRDGGAYAIGIYTGDDKRTVYVSPNDDIEGVLNEIREYYET